MRGLVFAAPFVLVIWAGIIWGLVHLGEPQSVWLVCDLLGQCN